MQKHLRGQVWFYNEADSTVNRSCQKDSVQRGSRPVIIVSNDEGNKHSPVVTVVPCTTQSKTQIPTHFEFIVNGTYNTALCEQVFTIGKFSLTTYKGTLEQFEIAQLDKCLCAALGLSSEHKQSTVFKKEPVMALYSSTDTANAVSTENSNKQIHTKEATKIQCCRTKTMRTRALKEEIINAYCNTKTDKELQELVDKYGFSNVKMLKQSVERWSAK
jgi:mRNA interferase MazF